MPNSEEIDISLSTRMVVLEPGMYILRLVAGNPAPETCLTLQPSPLGRGAVDFFPAEGVTRNTLSAPGDCIVVRVKGSKTALLVTEIHKKGSERVRLSIDSIITGQEFSTGDTRSVSVPVGSPAEAAATAAVAQPDALEAFAPVQAPAEPAAAPAAPAANAPVAPATITSQGHIERAGDVTVSNAWLGNPAGTHRLEGFALTWEGMPAGVNLAYSCRCGNGAEPQIGMAGQFVGTRRQAKPITAVAFVLSGPRANEFELSGNVAFAGLPPFAIVPGQELSGPSGAEHLVALQLVITPRASQAVPPASPWNNAAAARTFRAA